MFFRASMQRDGNFVLYTDEHRPVWSSRTVNNPGASLAFGNSSCDLMIKSKSGQTIWSSPYVCGKFMHDLNDDRFICFLVALVKFNFDKKITAPYLGNFTFLCQK